jgi:ATP-dependent RNA helicase DHX29
MLEQQVPEILRLSLQDPMLRIKVWDLGSIEETLNAAIDPPSRKNVLRAIEKLKDAGALTKSEALTPLGQQIARLPLEVSLAKLAMFGVIFRCLVSVILKPMAACRRPVLVLTSIGSHPVHHLALDLEIPVPYLLLLDFRRPARRPSNLQSCRLRPTLLL